MSGAESNEQEHPVVNDPLAAIPIKPDNVEVRMDSRGMMHLRLTVEPKGLGKILADWVRYD